MHAEQWLMGWQRDPESLDLALEVIDTSNNLNDVFFSTIAIDFILNNFVEQLDSEKLDIIFNILQRRFLHSLPPGLDEKCKNSIAENLACVSSINPNYMNDEYWSEFSDLDDIILYYTFLAEQYKLHSDNSSELFAERLTDENKINSLIQLLQEAEQITPQWIDLLKFIGLQVEFDTSILTLFMPALQTVPEQPQIYSKFFYFYDDVFTPFDSVGFTIEIPLAQELMMILVNIVEKLLDENEDEMQAVLFASVAWDAIMDYDDEFFFKCEDEFTSTLLEKFLASMRYLVIEPTEFQDLANTSSFNIISFVKNNNDFLPFILQLIDVIIFAINENFDEFINDKDNQISLSRTINSLTDFINEKDNQDEMPYVNYEQLESNKEELKRAIVEFFEEKLKEFSDGVIFAIASSSKYIKDNLAPFVSEQILASDPIPESSLHFIRLVDVGDIDVGSENIDGFVSLSYSSFLDDPNIPAIQAISEIALKKPQIFVDNYKELITPLITWIQESPPQLIPYIMTPLLYLVSYIYLHQPQNPFIERVTDLITKVISEQAGSLLQNDDLATMFNFILDIVHTAKSIIRSLKGTIQSEENAIIQFFYQIFNQFIEILEPLWHSQSEQVMISLCQFLYDSHKAKIVTDYTNIIKWIGEALYIEPVTNHFFLLLNVKPLFELLPTDPIMEFIVSFPDIEDAELQREVYSFIYNLFKDKWKDRFDYFEIELILSPLDSHDGRMVETAISLVRQLISSDSCDDFIEPILDMIVEGMLTNFQEKSIKDSIEILIDLIFSKKSGVDQIVQIVFNHLRFESKEAHDFQEALESLKSSDDDKKRIIRAAKRMVNLYSKPDDSDKKENQDE